MTAVSHAAASDQSDRAMRRVVVGVDPHQHLPTAVAVDELGGADSLERWSASLAGAAGRGLTFGVEGTGSYGSGAD